MCHFELFKMELKVIMVILNYEKYGIYIYIYISIYIYIYIYIMYITVYIHEQDEYLRSWKLDS